MMGNSSSSYFPKMTAQPYRQRVRENSAIQNMEHNQSSKVQVLLKARTCVRFLSAQDGRVV